MSINRNEWTPPRHPFISVNGHLVGHYPLFQHHVSGQLQGYDRSLDLCTCVHVKRNFGKCTEKNNDHSKDDSKEGSYERGSIVIGNLGPGLYIRIFTKNAAY